MKLQVYLGDAYWGMNDKEKAKKAYATYIKQMKELGKEKKIPQVILQRVKIRKFFVSYIPKIGTVDSSGIHFNTANYDANSGNDGVSSKAISIEDLAKQDNQTQEEIIHLQEFFYIK